MPLITVSGLYKKFEQHPILQGIELEVDAGQVVALIGRSGSGKSTLLRSLNGLTTFDAGSIQVDQILLEPGEHSKSELMQLRRYMGMVFQRFNLFPHLSAEQNVALALRQVKGLTRHEADRVAQRTLARVKMDERRHFMPSQLSGGQQQRVAIARAVAMEPKVLLCDEITSALDPELTLEVLDVVRDLASEGMTLLMATHEMDFAREISDTVIFLSNGRIHESGPPEQIFTRPVTPELERFLGGKGA
jgi:polar amino acid transport system ATP-binding protein